VSIGPWKWVRSDLASVPEDGLAEVTLGSGELTPVEAEHNS
jgi:hypothetical protein